MGELVIQNVNVVLPEQVLESGSVRLQDHLIQEVSENPWLTPEDPNGRIVDGQGAYLLPGFIDAHCHMGLAEEGLNFEGDDLNEITDPVTPQLRGIDAINPLNKSFEEAVSAPA